VPTAIAAVRRLRIRDTAWGRRSALGACDPPFDAAIEHYDHFDQRFEPNVKSALPADLSDAYMDHQLPGFLWNFQHSGYKLMGGRIDRLEDGSSVAYTFYRGDNGSILCTYMKSHGLLPPGGETQEIGGHHCYRTRATASVSATRTATSFAYWCRAAR